MSTVTGTIEAISRKFGKFGILIDGQWYNTKQEWAPSPEPNTGDTVTFDNGGKNFIQKLKITGSGGATGGSGGSGGKTFSNYGIEIGHASNLAMRVMEQRLEQGGASPAVGGEAYYKQFVEETKTIFRLMKAIRTSIESGDGKAAMMEEELEDKPKVSSEDIF